MSSTYQFESGLNDWIDTDKPTRVDFVRDNRILTEKVMWAENYDPTGEVGAVGIAAYVNKLSTNTGWKTLTLNPGISGTVKYRKVGHNVEVDVDVSGLERGANNIILGFLPDGYRPEITKWFLGYANALVIVTSTLVLSRDGQLQILANGNTTTCLASPPLYPVVSG